MRLGSWLARLKTLSSSASMRGRAPVTRRRWLKWDNALRLCVATSTDELSVVDRTRTSSNGSTQPPSDLQLPASSQQSLGSVTVRTLDLWSRGRGFNSRSGRYKVVSTWMGDCLRTGKPSRYITNTKVNSAFHPSGIGKSRTGLHGWG